MSKQSKHGYFFNILILTGLLILALVGCRMSKDKSPISDKSKDINNTSIPFQILSAEYYSWKAGIESGGKGRKYRIIAIMRTYAQIQFDSLKLKHITLPIFLSQKMIKSNTENYIPAIGDTITINAEEIFKKNSQNSTHPFVSISGNQQGVLQFRTNGNTHTFPLDTIKEVHIPNRP